SMVAAGSSSPVFSWAARPASTNSQDRPGCIASSTCRVASMISVPMPSPRMTEIVCVIAGGSSLACGDRPLCRGGWRRLELLPEIHCPAQVRDDDAAADHEADGEGLEHLPAADPGLPALGHVVADAVVAAQD